MTPSTLPQKKGQVGRQASRDHVLARSNGGGDHQSNIVFCCRSCNSSKGHRDLENFRTIFLRQLLGIPRFSLEQWDWMESQGVSNPKGKKLAFLWRTVLPAD
jgi:hypothetical protein